MNEKMTNVAVGVVAVVLAYALYSHFKKPAATGTPLAPASFAPTGAWSQNPIGADYNTATPGNFVGIDDLEYAAAHGVNYSEMAPASLDDLSYAAIYGTAPKPAPQVDSVFLPGRLKW